MFKKRTIIIGLILLLAIGVLISLGCNYSEHKMRNLAEETAKKIYGIENNNLVHVKARKFESPFITKFVRRHKIFKIDIPTQPPGTILIAVGYDNKIFRLPKEFNEFIRRENVLINTEQKTIEFIRFYLTEFYLGKPYYITKCK